MLYHVGVRNYKYMSMNIYGALNKVAYKSEPRFHELRVMDGPTIPVFAEENLGDLIDIRVDIIHLEPVAAVAFPAAAVMRIQAQYGEAIRGVQEHLLGVPIQIQTAETIKKITHNRKRQVRIEMEQQLAAVQKSQRED
ncbi:hypothetical protein Tco_1081993 [Tanacetum coccineum]|uniref:Band 7 domain-containing protein n=1 Tax=Tanacetum coccineum TaxID=301880 RepID=A0ABQ5HZ53_9ASTR